MNSYNPISRYEHLAIAANIGEGKIIIDCSCGNGKEGKTICQKYKPYIYFGIDIDGVAINKANTLNMPTPCKFAVGDIRNSSPIHGDYYFCVETLEHLPRHENSRVGKAITHSIKPEGLLLISVPGNPNIAMEDRRHKQIITKDVILSMFNKLTLIKEDTYVKFFGRPEAYSAVYILKREGL